MKKFILWTLAFIITVSAAIYQRHTGPTYPKKLDMTLNEQLYKLRLVRSLALDERSEVKLNITDTTVRQKFSSSVSDQMKNISQLILNTGFILSILL